jgi:hypothetical protein
MRNLIVILNAILLVFMLSCSEDSLKNSEIIDTTEEKGDMLVSDDFNKAFPEGYQEEDNAVANSFKENFELKSTDPDKAVSVASKVVLPVPHKYQQKSYWCGPASAQMVNYYFNMPASQAYIASRCGTTSSLGTYVYRLVKWFNDPPMTGNKDLPSGWKWAYVYITDYANFKYRVQRTLGTFNCPQVWHLKTYPSGTYHLPGYTKNYGHYVVGSGYNFSGSTPYVMYDDPWYGPGGGPDKWVRAYTAYKCIKANAGLIIW